MTTQITTQPGGFTGDPFAALNPPVADSGGCCGSDQTDAVDACATTPTAGSAAGCCGQPATPATAGTDCC